MRDLGFREDLDEVYRRMPRGENGTVGFYFTATCHPTSGLKVHYLAGVLTVFCSECKRPVVKVAVAQEEVVLHA